MVTHDKEQSTDEDATVELHAGQRFHDRLSSSAHAVLRAIRVLEEGESIDLFQKDPDFDKLRRITTSYKGSLYRSLERRLSEVIEMGGVSVITQRDLMSVIYSIWGTNVSRLSKKELTVLSGAIGNPGAGLGELATHVGLTYSQTRRALHRLRSADVLRTIGLLDVQRLGLERILVRFESPGSVLYGPYVENLLFVDGKNPMVFLTLTIPRDHLKELLNIVKGLRGEARSVTAWRMSKGRPRFSYLYYNERDGRWQVDLFHWRLLLRAGGSGLIIGSNPRQSSLAQRRFTLAELEVLNELLCNYDATAQEIVKETGLSESTAFRKRAKLIQEVIQPRAQVNIPVLRDRLLAVLDETAAGDFMPAWGALPLTYVSLIENLENRREKKILLLSALPAGQAPQLISVLNEEKSLADDVTAYSVLAGIRGRIRADRITWEYNPALYDTCSYETAREGCEGGSGIPIDLA
jgi:DNA-binding MarR family transcriptional regulator